MQSVTLQKLKAFCSLGDFREKRRKRKMQQRGRERKRVWNRMKEREKKGRQRSGKDRGELQISYQPWAEVFLPLSLLCPSYLLVEDFLQLFSPVFAFSCCLLLPLHAPNAGKKMHLGNTERNGVKRAVNLPGGLEVLIRTVTPAPLCEHKPS